LVGPSGAGKSTVFDLILRFYNVESGRILLDGQNIAGVSRHSLRSQVAYVGQIVQLFRGTIRENIAFGKVGASDDEIITAAKAAHAHEFILGFPAGYDSPVGEHGMQLSGGQRQRIAIARALIKNAPIILLDEPTAALDSESEQNVQEAFAELRKGRTTLVIAHRLSTIMHADNILVMESGLVVESGRHEGGPTPGKRFGRPLSFVCHTPVTGTFVSSASLRGQIDPLRSSPWAPAASLYACNHRSRSGKSPWCRQR
jgi:ABC-type multidrug transport system fused ATPase/permease subunit